MDSRRSGRPSPVRNRVRAKRLLLPLCPLSPRRQVGNAPSATQTAIDIVEQGLRGVGMPIDADTSRAKIAVGVLVVLPAGLRLQMGWVHTTTMKASRSTSARQVPVVTQVVHVPSFGDRANPVLVSPDVSYPNLLPAHAELSIAIRGDVGHPVPTAVRLLGHLGHEPSRMIQSVRRLGDRGVSVSLPANVVHPAPTSRIDRFDATRYRADVHGLTLREKHAGCKPELRKGAGHG